MITVLLVDDHILIRAGLQRLLEQTGEITVAAMADRGDTAVLMDAELTPDVVLMDVSMPGMSGIETTRQIRASRDASVVMLTASTDRGQVLDALDAGAIGYLVKDSDPAVLIAGVRAAANGDAPLDARAARAVLEVRPRNATELTKRETEVLELVTNGLANKAIARQLAISEKTVKAHLTRVFSELDVSDRTQAALWAQEHLGCANRDQGSRF
ncbi:MAG: response regulator transcription factor [Actinobacteria bacterium]|nr:response regulator transcription factor [Actinomycetota bacterium]